MLRYCLAVIGLFVCLKGIADASAIDTLPGHKQLYREIAQQLDNRHYRQTVIDDVLSRRYLERYIDMLDPQKSYFLQADITSFEQWATDLDNLLSVGDVSPGFAVYNRLRLRALDQLKSNIALLKTDFVFDLESQSSLLVDSEKRVWLSSPEEAKSYWIKRMTDSLIRLLLNDKEPVAARELLIKRFENQLKQFKQRDSEDVFQLYVNALAGLYDPHTAYQSPRTSENFQISMSLSLEGIGAELRTEDDYTLVARIIPGGPADAQGILQAGDKIIGVGQADDTVVDVVGWRIDDVVDLIRGPKNSTVRLQVLAANDDGGGVAKVFPIVRDRVKLEEKSAQKRVIEVPDSDRTYRIGVIELPAFYMDFEAYRARDPDYKSTSRDVFKLLQELSHENIDGIVLDLRSNGGGSLREAIQLTDLFIETGPVVQIRDTQKRVSPVQKATHRSVYRGPLLVMINRLSASASEIFAGALQDYGRALVVGSQSFGKGTVQDVTDLSRGQLKMTISKFYRVSGDSTQHRGVVPDIGFPSAFDPDEIGESHQETALPWDRIAALPFNANRQLGGYIEPLALRHSQRSQKEPDFAHFVAQLALNEQWRDESTLSLNLETRRQRVTEWDLKMLALENNRRRDSGLPVYGDVQSWKDAEAIENAKTHIVEDGDSVSNIAKKYRVPVEQIVAANKAEDLDPLKVDDILKLGKPVRSDKPDPLLKEASHILVDQIRLQAEPPIRRQLAATMPQDVTP